jgi:hypothetical protein
MDALDVKIQDLDLRSFANGNAKVGPRSVIVELDIPPAQINVRKSAVKPRAKGAEESSAAPAVSIEEVCAMDHLEGALRSLGFSRDLRRLEVSQAFVVDASPEQLRSIASLPGVGAIRSNKTHKVPPK